MKVMTLRHISEYQMRDWDKWRKTVQDVYHLDPTSLRESVQFLAEQVSTYLITFEYTSYGAPYQING